MRFLVDANMPRSAVVALRRFGHDADHVNDLGLKHAPDSEIANRARSSGAALITRDLDLADVRRYPPADHAGLIVLRSPDDAVASLIANVLGRFLKQTTIVEKIAGRLVVLEADHFRIRPPLD